MNFCTYDKSSFFARNIKKLIRLRVGRIYIDTDVIAHGTTRAAACEKNSRVVMAN